MVPRRKQPRGPLDHVRAKGGKQPGPAEEPDDPALPPDRGCGGCRLLPRPPVEPGDRWRERAAVGAGRDERRPLADGADRKGLHGTAGAGLGTGDPHAADEGRPPGVRALLGAARGAVEEQAIRHAGEAPETAVEPEDAHLRGGGPEIDGNEDAGVCGHEAEW